MFDESALLFVVSLIQKDELFRVKTKIFPEAEPWLVFKPSVILMNETVFIHVYCWYIVHSLVVWIFLAANCHELKQTHLAQTHVFLI